MKYLVFVISVGFAISCNFITTNSSDIIIDVVPTVPSFTFADTGRIYFSINNLSDNTIYYSTCIEPTLKKKIQTAFNNLPPSDTVCECI